MSQDKEDSGASADPADAIVDRDDEDSDGLSIDPRGEDPSPDREGSRPDPGYAAFADDFDDPLADWPGPDASIDIEAEEARAALRSDPAPSEAAADDDDYSGDLAFPDDDREPSGVTASSPSAVDTDEATELDADEAEAAALTLASSDAATYTDRDTPEDDWNPDWSSSEDEDIVDDFLADLDDGDSETSGSEPRADDMPGSTVVAAVSAHGAATAAAGTARAAAAGSERSPAGGDSGDSGDSRQLPLLTIAIVVVALLLLGVGGYGVVQQRGAMEAEIRDLQARLATTMSADESASVREQLRRLEVDNERLAAEISALQAANARLRESLQRDAGAAVEAGADAEGATAAAGETAAAKQRDAAAQEAESEPAAPAPEANAGGTAVTGSNAPAATEQWFVNFGSYTRQLVAEQWAEQLEVDDGEVIVQTASSGGRTVYRVRVVGLASRDDAERVALDLERSFQLPRLWIGRQ